MPASFVTSNGDAFVMLHRSVHNLMKEGTAPNGTPLTPDGVIDAAEALVGLQVVTATDAKPDTPNLLNPFLPAPFPPIEQRAASRRPPPPRPRAFIQQPPILSHPALNMYTFAPPNGMPPHQFASHPSPYGPYGVAQHLLSSGARLRRLDSADDIHNKKLRLM